MGTVLFPPSWPPACRLQAPPPQSCFLGSSAQRGDPKPVWRVPAAPLSLHPFCAQPLPEAPGLASMEPQVLSWPDAPPGPVFSLLLSLRRPWAPSSASHPRALARVCLLWKCFPQTSTCLTPIGDISSDKSVLCFQGNLGPMHPAFILWMSFPSDFGPCGQGLDCLVRHRVSHTLPRWRALQKWF